jgi:hypothetical protein
VKARTLLLNSSYIQDQKTKKNPCGSFAGQFTKDDKSAVYEGGDYALTIPLHFVTFGLSTLTPLFKTKGTIAMANMAYKIPECGAAKELERQESDNYNQ